MHEIEALFPVPLLRAPALLEPALVDTLAGLALAAHTTANSQSARLSHTEIMGPDAQPAFRAAAERAAPKLEAFGEALFGDRLRWAVKEMWSNVLDNGGSQAPHVHANSFVSGIFFLSESDASANTVFVRNPVMGEFAFRHNTPTTTVGRFNAGKWVLPELKPGDLVLFPSYLLHEVPVNRGARRVTMAFNAVPERLDSFGYAISFGP